MNKMFENKVGFVTGAAVGFGFGIAERMLEYGAKTVWISDFNPITLKQATAELEAKFPGRVKSLVLDVTKGDDFERALDRTVEESGSLDFLFNNAGRPMTCRTIDIEPEDFIKLIELDYIAVVRGTLRALRIMEKQKSGYVISASSVAGIIPSPHQCAYGSAKAAVAFLMQDLAYEYANTDIHFSHYAPANVATKIFAAQYAEKLRKEGKSEEEILELTKDVKPPADAISLEEALDVLFDGIEKYEAIIPIGQIAVDYYKLYCTDRAAYDKEIMKMQAARKAYYDAVAERKARGESCDDLVFPG